MEIVYIEIKLYASWIHSLKEKRSLVKRLISRVSNKFNVSVCESGDKDSHANIIICIASLASSKSQAYSISDNIVNFIEDETDAQIVDISREIR